MIIILSLNFFNRFIYIFDPLIIIKSSIGLLNY